MKESVTDVFVEQPLASPRSTKYIGWDKHVRKQTDGHINTMTWTGLRAGPSENLGMI